MNVGLSWIYDRGYTGISYSNRRDQYGLPGHSHEYETCSAHLTGRPHLHCDAHEHDHEEGEEAHAHEEHEHEHGGPWIDLKSERYDFKTELNDPFAGFQSYVPKRAIQIISMMKLKKGQSRLDSKTKVMMGVLS